MADDGLVAALFERVLRIQRSNQSEMSLAHEFKALLVQAGALAWFIGEHDGRRWLPDPWLNLPEGFAEAYAKYTLIEVDPIIDAVLAANRPVRWTEVWTETPTPQLKSAAELFRQFGFSDGLTVAIVGPHRKFDLINIAFPADITMDCRIDGLVAFACHVVWWQVIRLRGGANVRSENLTYRELQVLRWIKEGKSNRDIGTITSLTERAVEFHVRNILRKLDAGTKMTAVINALRIGIINL